MVKIIPSTTFHPKVLTSPSVSDIIKSSVVNCLEFTVDLWFQGIPEKCILYNN